MLQIYYLSALSHIKSVPKFENHTCNDGEKKRVCEENIGFYTLKRMNIEKSFFPVGFSGLYRDREQTDGEGLSERRRRGAKKSIRKEKTLQDEGPAEEKGQLLFLSYGNRNEVGHGAQDNRGHRQVERHRVNCFLLGSHLALTFTD